VAGWQAVIAASLAAELLVMGLPPRVLLVFLLSLAALGGCTTRQVTVTDRSAVEQELLVRSLERAIHDLDLTALQGRTVTLDLFGLTRDQSFAREFLAARLQQRGVHVTGVTEEADIRLRAFATVLGVDQGETLLGIPQMAVPLVGIPIPEIALFKWTRNRGAAEVQLFAYERPTGRFLARVPDVTGASKFDRFTILILVNFTVTDLDRRPLTEDAQASPPTR
jgi:hypothetical protein